MKKFTIISTVNGQDPIAIGSYNTREQAEKEAKSLYDGAMHYNNFNEEYKVKEYDEESNPTPDYIVTK